MRRVRNVLVALVLLAFSTGFNTAQSATTLNDGKNRDRIKWLQPTLQGTTGLFNVYSAEGLRQGEFSFQGGASNYDRNPGNLDITNIPFTFTLGLHDRLEWSVGFLPWRRVRTIGSRRGGYYNETPFLRPGTGTS